MSTENQPPVDSIEDLENPPPLENIDDLEDDQSTFTDTPETPTEKTDESVKDDVDDARTTQFEPSLNIAHNVKRTRKVYGVVGPSRARLVPILGSGKRPTTMNENEANWPSPKEIKDNPELERHIELINRGMSQQVIASLYGDANVGMYDRALQNKENVWEQGFSAGDGQDVYIRHSRVTKQAGERRVSGAAVSDIIGMGMGLGTGLTIPLPGTGPHITLSPRSTEDYITLDVQMGIDRRELGRHTVGLIYQNSYISLVERAMEFIAGSVRRYNRTDSENINIFDEISIIDLPILLWGQGCTTYPDGYPYEIPCSSGPKFCRHVEHVNLQLDDMLWINTAKLSKTQREKLGNRGHKFTDEDIKIYRESSSSPLTKTFSVGAYDITVSVPSITRYLEAGRAWLNDLSERAKELFAGEGETEAQQRAYVEQLINVASLREYSAWIKKIVVNKTYIVEDSDIDVATALETLSKQPEIVKAVLEKLQAFIEDSTIAIIAIPNFACPKCEKDYVTDEFEKHPELIPIDMLKLFFELKDRRIYLQTPSTDL